MIKKPFSNPGTLLAAAGSAFVWQEHTRQILTTALLSMVPTFEGRYAVAVAGRMGSFLGRLQILPSASVHRAFMEGSFSKMAVKLGM